MSMDAPPPPPPPPPPKDEPPRPDPVDLPSFDNATDGVGGTGPADDGGSAADVSGAPTEMGDGSAAGGGVRDAVDEPTVSNATESEAMRKWEAAEDDRMAADIIAGREHIALLREQGNEEGARQEEEFLARLPVSDAIKADPQGYLDSRRQAKGGDGDTGSPDRVPTGDSRLEAVWDVSEATPSGRSYIHPSDGFTRQSAQDITPADGEYTVAAHGNPDAVVIADPDGDHTPLSPEDMADLIRSDPDWKGEPIRLVSCDTGKTPADGSDPYAQRLADSLGVDVIAPTERAWEEDGEVWSSTPEWAQDEVTGKWFEQPATPRHAPNGEMKRFQARRR